MIDERDVHEMLHRRANAVSALPADPPRALRRARRRMLVNGAVASLVAVAIVAATVAGVDAIRRAPVPADDRSEGLGIFAPVAGRIVYVNEAEVGDLGYDTGLWAIDPSGPADTLEGPSVADDVASTLVPLGLGDVEPLGWSSDGTELLFKRSSDDLFPQEYLYVLHADGSETQLNEEPMYLGGASISPDGSRVVFAAWGDHLGLYIADSQGGEPDRLPLPGAEGIVMAPTFSPDGTRMAFVDSGESENHVWVMDADGGDAHQILRDEAMLVGFEDNLQWSAGNRLAIQVQLSNGDDAIYTFAPDGSDFTQVVTRALSPHWSPDGTQIAYTIECERTDVSCGGLAIADADGSDIRAFGFAASGPWHPGASAEPNGITTTPGDGFSRSNGEVLRFTGVNEEVPGDLVAVNPDTGEERVLVEDLDDVYSASWSADGRWVAYETDAADGGWRDLWVAGEAEEPQLVATGGDPGLFADIGLYWTWSPTGAELATIGRSKLTTIDLSTGETTHLGKVTADLLETNQPPTWAWSPDGTRLVFAAPEGAPDGSLYTVDVRTGERSLLARLPDDRDLTEKVVWSPDGTRIAVLIRKASNEAGRLYVMDADGSDIQVMADDYDPLGIAWSPDGTRLAFGDGSPPDPMARIRIVPMDGGAPAEIELTLAGCEFNYMCRLTWSPDGSRLAFHNSFAWVAVDADGRGEAEPIDELTYLSWEGGSYPWEP